MEQISSDEQALVSGVKDYREGPQGMRLAYLAASCGFRLSPATAWASPPQPEIYKIHARSRHGILTLYRNVSGRQELPPWRLSLLIDGGGDTRPEFKALDLWPAEKEQEHQISGAAVFAVFAAGVLILAGVVWIARLLFGA